MKKFFAFVLSFVGVSALAFSSDNPLHVGIVFERVGETIIEKSDQKIFVRFKFRVNPFNTHISIPKKHAIQIVLKEKETGSIVSTFDGLYEKPFSAELRGNSILFPQDKNTMFTINAFCTSKGIKAGNYIAEISNIIWRCNGRIQEFKPLMPEKFQTNQVMLP